MLPSVLASEIQEGLETFLKAQFPVSSPGFKNVFNEFLKRDKNGHSNILKGPYVTLKMPFRPGNSSQEWFPGILPDYFKPYIHQQKAWERIGRKIRVGPKNCRFQIKIIVFSQFPFVRRLKTSH